MDKEARRLAVVESGAELDEFCARHGYSNDLLAKELDVSRATIFNWKKDGRAVPRIVSLALFALQSAPELRKMNPRDGEGLRKQYRRSSYSQRRPGQEEK